MDDLKKKYGREYDSLAAWYSKLDKEGKKAVKRLGLPDDTEYFYNGFHAE